MSLDCKESNEKSGQPELSQIHRGSFSDSGKIFRE